MSVSVMMMTKQRICRPQHDTRNHATVRHLQDYRGCRWLAMIYHLLIIKDAVQKLSQFLLIICATQITEGFQLLKACCYALQSILWGA